MEELKLLLPIDVVACPLGVFDVVNRFSQSCHLTVILLHVLTLNVFGVENRIYEELRQETKEYLEKLASSYLGRNISSVLQVRHGRPSEEILAQVATDHPDTVLLPVQRILHDTRSKMRISTLVRKIIQGADCGVLVLPFNRSFNCEKAWGRQPLPVETEQSSLLRVASPIVPA